MTGTLYVVATPIGNLEDITLRAIRVLKEVALIAAEDTRKTMRLLSRYDIHTPLQSYHRHSDRGKLGWLLEALRGAGRGAGLGGGDARHLGPRPGADRRGDRAGRSCRSRSRALRAHRCPGGVGPAGRPLPLSGLSAKGRSDRRRLLESVRAQPFTLVAFEAPHRLLAALADLEEVLGDRQAAAARELTKLHEEVVRGPISQLRAVFRERPPRGEFTLVIAPGRRTPSWRSGSAPSSCRSWRGG